MPITTATKAVSSQYQQQKIKPLGLDDLRVLLDQTANDALHGSTDHAHVNGAQNSQARLLRCLAAVRSTGRRLRAARETQPTLRAALNQIDAGFGWLNRSLMHLLKTQETASRLRRAVPP
jgi:hypothetical protein